MWHKVIDLSPDQRHAIEGLLGRPLSDDEGLNIQPSHVLKDAPIGDERKSAFDQYLGNLDELAHRAHGAEDELDALIDEARNHAQHRHS